MYSNVLIVGHLVFFLVIV